MPTQPFKGNAAHAIDAWYATGHIAANLQEAQTHLASGDPFTKIVSDLGGKGHSRPEFQYPSDQPDFEAVARQAYLQGIALAQGHSPPVPISTFWVAGAAKYDAHAVDGDPVTVTLEVPLAPPPWYSGP
jgi:hypothetical protein